MRDGAVLQANVIRPSGGRRHPVLVFRTPYDKDLTQITFMTLDAFRAAEAGFAVVHQDTRGRFASEGGPYDPIIHEFEDGFDTVEWAAAQPWSNGAVGLFGTSYHGLTSWAAATTAPPSLRAIAPSQAPIDHYDSFWRGGAFNLGAHAHWALRVMAPNAMLRAYAEADLPERVAALEHLVANIDDYDSAVGGSPLGEFPAGGGRTNSALSFVYELFDRRRRHDVYYRQRSITGRHAEVRVPALISAGWNDPLLSADLSHYRAMRTEAATASAREDTRLLIGPWVHGVGMHSAAATEIDFGLRASGLAMDLREDLTAYHLRWFNRWLCDGPDSGDARVRLFVMGENRWRSADDWPPPASGKTVRWNLHSDGGLSPRQPELDAQPRTYVHDPSAPVPTLGGGLLLPPQFRSGTVSQTELLDRPDVLVFTSEVLQQPVEVIGHVRAKVWAATTAADADWIVKLCDVHVDGRTFNVCDGIVRASRRDDSWDMPQPLQPGELTRYDIDLAATAIVFKPGHRLRVLVMSSDFPRYDRNPGTGEWSFDAASLVPATHKIFCDAMRPSFIEVPGFADTN